MKLNSSPVFANSLTGWVIFDWCECALQAVHIRIAQIKIAEANDLNVTWLTIDFPKGLLGYHCLWNLDKDLRRYEEVFLLERSIFHLPNLPRHCSYAPRCRQDIRIKKTENARKIGRLDEAWMEAIFIETQNLKGCHCKRWRDYCDYKFHNFENFENLTHISLRHF